MKNNIYTLLLVFLLLSCNNTKNKDIENMNNKVQDIEKELIVKFKFKTNKEDIIKLILNKIKVDEYQTKNIQIVERVAPSNEYETINANFGINNFSKVFMIHLGSREAKKIDLKSIEISYGNKLIIINPEELEKYFSINKFIKKEGSILVTSKIDDKLEPVLKLKNKVFKDLK